MSRKNSCHHVVYKIDLRIFYVYFREWFYVLLKGLLSHVLVTSHAQRCLFMNMVDNASLHPNS